METLRQGAVVFITGAILFLASTGFAFAQGGGGPADECKAEDITTGNTVENSCVACIRGADGQPKQVGAYCKPLFDGGSLNTNCFPSPSMPPGTCQVKYCTPGDDECSVTEASNISDIKDPPQSKEALKQYTEDYLEEFVQRTGNLEPAAQQAAIDAFKNANALNESVLAESLGQSPFDKLEQLIENPESVKELPSGVTTPFLRDLAGQATRLQAADGFVGEFVSEESLVDPSSGSIESQDTFFTPAVDSSAAPEGTISEEEFDFLATGIPEEFQNGILNFARIAEESLRGTQEILRELTTNSLENFEAVWGQFRGPFEDVSADYEAVLLTREFLRNRMPGRDITSFADDPELYVAAVDATHRALKATDRLHPSLQDPDEFRAWVYAVTAKEVTAPSRARPNEEGSGAAGFMQLTRIAVLDTLGFNDPSAKTDHTQNIAVGGVYLNKLFHQHGGDTYDIMQHYSGGGYSTAAISAQKSFLSALKTGTPVSVHGSGGNFGANSSASNEWGGIVRIASAAPSSVARSGDITGSPSIPTSDPVVASAPRIISPVRTAADFSNTPPPRPKPVISSAGPVRSGAGEAPQNLADRISTPGQVLLPFEPAPGNAAAREFPETPTVDRPVQTGRSINTPSPEALEFEGVLGESVANLKVGDNTSYTFVETGERVSVERRTSETVLARMYDSEGRLKNLVIAGIDDSRPWPSNPNVSTVGDLMSSVCDSCIYNSQIDVTREDSPASVFSPDSSVTSRNVTPSSGRPAPSFPSYGLGDGGSGIEPGRVTLGFGPSQNDGTVDAPNNVGSSESLTSSLTRSGQTSIAPRSLGETSLSGNGVTYETPSYQLFTPRPELIEYDTVIGRSETDPTRRVFDVIGRSETDSSPIRNFSVIGRSETDSSPIRTFDVIGRSETDSSPVRVFDTIGRAETDPAGMINTTGSFVGGTDLTAGFAGKGFVPEPVEVRSLLPITSSPLDTQYRALRESEFARRISDLSVFTDDLRPVIGSSRSSPDIPSFVRETMADQTRADNAARVAESPIRSIPVDFGSYTEELGPGPLVIGQNVPLVNYNAFAIKPPEPPPSLGQANVSPGPGVSGSAAGSAQLPKTTFTYSGSSVVEGLSSGGYCSTYACRTTYAQLLAPQVPQLQNYSGSAAQNQALLDAFKGNVQVQGTVGIREAYAPSAVQESGSIYSQATRNYPTGSSITQFLEAGNLNSSFLNRTSLFNTYIGGATYRGTAEQNIQLLNCLRTGIGCGAQ